MVLKILDKPHDKYIPKHARATPMVKQSKYLLGDELISLQKGTPNPSAKPSQSAYTAPLVPSIWWELGSLAAKIVVISVSFMFIFTFCYGFHRSADPDMAPMVKAGDLILFYRLDKNYSVGDILLLDFLGERQVQRVVAKAGDTVDIMDGGLIINGGPHNEPEIFQETWQYANAITFPLTIEEGQVFVLGDARDNATDSRIYGPVNTKDTLGKVITVIRRRGL